MGVPKWVSQLAGRSSAAASAPPLEMHTLKTERVVMSVARCIAYLEYGQADVLTQNRFIVDTCT